MSFDLSRIRFDARQDFLGVVMQQGRVQLDADWNEWVAQLARRLQAGTLDTFSGSVVPRTTPEGFRILANAGALSIGVGRIYVDGLLAENHGGTPDVWDTRLAETTGTTPLDYTMQPYYPDPPALPQAGRHLVYVDVWQRDITALQQPGLIEQAVGVDTTGRLQTVWQVKLLAEVGNATCSSDDEDVPGWTALTAPSAGRLTTATGVPDFEPNPCEVAPAAGYRGLENQLYRVEVHTGGGLGTASFKWSRDNATVAARVTHINPARDRITVDSIGRDDILRFNDGDWVEVTDDWRELKNLPGELHRIRLAGGVDETARTLVFESALPAGLFPTNAQQATDAGRNTRVRRWDQGGPVRREDGTEIQNLDSSGAGGILIPATGTRVFLEHGILVDFSLTPAGGHFHSGDYWVFAARSNDASIELLDQTPPRGIHHHYARLAMVSFPDVENDCRTLWPPESAAGGCDCSVCVTAEGHNSGTATLQQAIDRVKDGGGTICLGIGRYDIGAPLDIIDARSLRIRGQGWATLLVGREPGCVVRIADATGVALENLSVIGSADRSGTTAIIEASNTVDLRAEHINVLGLAPGDGRSVAIGLAGNLLGARIHDCALVAHQGVARVAARDREHLLSAELTLDDNLFFCSQRALSLDGICLHFGNTRISGNLMLNGDQHAIVVTGAVLGGSSLKIADNVIYTTGGGILAGVAGLAIEGNEISGLDGQTDERPDGDRGADGIVITDGLFPSAIDNVRIVANRLRLLRGNAITLSRPLVSARIAENRIRAIGLGAIVMDRDASAESLVIFANNCRGLGLATSNDKSPFAAVQLIRVERCDVSDNTIADVALEGVAAAAIDGLFAAAIGQLRIHANRIHAIGPERSGGELSAVHVLPPCDRIVIAGNHLDRVGDADRKVAAAQWRAIRIAPGATGDARRTAPAHYFSNGEAVFLLTMSAIDVRVVRSGDAAIQDNQLRAVETLVPLNLCAGVEHCLFSGNHCESSTSRSERAQLGEINARSINASNNRLIGRGDSSTLFLRPGRKLAIVIGNTSTGKIEVDGAPLPNDVLLTNLIGV